MLALRSSVLFHGWTVKMTARVRYLRSTTETERKPAQWADDVLKLCQPTMCLEPRQLTASLSLGHENSLFGHNRFSTLFFSMKVAESDKIVLASCILDFKDIQV